LVGREEGHPACKKMRGMVEVGTPALVSPNAVTPNRIVGMSASVNHQLHHKVQKFSSGTSSSWWSQKKGRKMVVVWVVVVLKQKSCLTLFL